MKGIKNLFKWVKPYIWLLIIVLSFNIILPFTYSYVPQFIKYIFDDVIANADSNNTLPIFILNFFDKYEGVTCALIVGVILAIYQIGRGMVMVVEGYIRGYFSEKMAYDMRTRLFSHIQDLSYTYHNGVDTGDLIQRCTSDVDTIRGFISAQLPQIINIFANLASGAYQMYSINKNIMLITLCVIPITGVSSFFYFRYVRKKFEQIENSESEMTTVLQENVNGVRVVKAFAQEEAEIKKFNKKSKKFKNESFTLNRAMALYWAFSDGITILQYAITICYCIYLRKNNAVTVGDLTACITYISMLVYPIRSLGRIIGNFGKAIVAANRIDEVLQEENEYVTDGKLETKISGNIEFKDVYFKFDDSNKYFLNGVNFSIKSGETIAIVGKTGCGKSTIANILVRMLDYEKGSILIDGVELRDLKKKWVRQNIGIILQDPFLYAKTIYENIGIANKKITREEVYKAAQIASVHNDIVNFDEGYNTLVGEKGVTLSGGQKQRVAIARMLVLNKPIMIFDDSLSAVDTKTDLQIRNALRLRDQELTSIIITHRITTAKEADKIIVLENGVVSEIGTHQELANKEGLYKSLWEIQGSLENEFLNLVDKEVNE